MHPVLYISMNIQDVVAAVIIRDTMNVPVAMIMNTMDAAAAAGIRNTEKKKQNRRRCPCRRKRRWLTAQFCLRQV